MKDCAFGSLRFDRKSIPVELGDIAHWPTVDEHALSTDNKERLERRIRAITLFVANQEPLRAISRETGVAPSEIYRLFERCIAPNPDGRIFGLRALIPYQRVGRYTRRSPVGTACEGWKGGASGALRQLLCRYPQIATWLEKRIAERARAGGPLVEVHRHGRRLHSSFLDQCRRAGIQADQYPFNKTHLAARSLSTYVRSMARERFDEVARSLGARQISHRWNDSGLIFARLRRPRMKWSSLMAIR